MSKSTTIATILLVFFYSCENSLDKNNCPRTSIPEQAYRENILSPLQKLEKVFKGLHSYDDNGKHEGITYKLSTENELPENWLIASHPEDDNCELLDRISNLLYTKVKLQPKKKHFIDIMTLKPSVRTPIDFFHEVLADSILSIAKSSENEVIIRHLEGSSIASNEAIDKNYFYNRLIEKHKNNGGKGEIKLFSASVNYPYFKFFIPQLSMFNHAKVLAINGESSIVGGHNYRDDHIKSESNTPPYDLSMHVNGAATKDSHGFANYLWEDILKSKKNCIAGYSFSQKKSLEIDETSFPFFNPKEYKEHQIKSSTKNIPILAVGNLGIWYKHDLRTLIQEFVFSESCQPENTYNELENSFNKIIHFPFSKWQYDVSKSSNASLTARSIFMKSVKQNGKIRISQESLSENYIVSAGLVLWPGDFLEAISEAIIGKNATVEIILSRHSLTDYGDFMGSKATKGVIVDYLAKKTQNQEAAKLLSEKYLKIRETPNGVYNHSKLWMVDDDIFYIGSDNIYPAGLSEYGYIIGSKAACDELLEKHWTPLWAISLGHK